MRNRPISQLHEEAAPRSLANELNLDRNPLVRLVVLFLVLVTPFLAITGKLIQLQGLEQDDFADGLEQKLSESFQPIPTNDGRILMGGTVLARDVATYRLKLHYRWLEEPADAGWLKRKAQARLSKTDRKKREHVLAAQEQILEERRRMWDRLATAMNVPPDEFASRRAEIQKRVEHVVELVDAKRQQRIDDEQQERDKELQQLSDQQDWAQRLATQVKHELTTPPRRKQVEPVVVQEELEYHVIAENIPFERVAEIVTQPTLFPGVEYEITTRRDYPQGPLAGHLVGFRKAIDPQSNSLNGDAANALESSAITTAEASPDDRTGQAGLERSYDRFLCGRRGELRIVRDAEGEIIRREVVRDAQPGADIELALVEPLQRRAEALLDRATQTRPLRWDDDVLFVKNGTLPEKGGERDENGEPPPQVATGGCILAMNVATGELLAAACAPRFDIRVMVDFREDIWKQLQSDPRRPMFPRTTAMALPPGSVFKTMISIAALEEHVSEPTSTVQCDGYFDPKQPTKHRCYAFKKTGHGHGPLSVVDALAKSCNIYFFTQAKLLGPQRLVSWSHRLGFGELSGIDVPGESVGLVPLAGTEEFLQLAEFEEGSHLDRSAANGVVRVSGSSPRPRRWSQAATIEYGIGQSDLAVTPLQIVRMMAAVANGGELVSPRLVHEVSVIRDGRRSRVDLPESKPQPTGVSERTLHFVREGLEAVVVRGTASHSAKHKQVTVAGKTGTAETGLNRPDHAWFAGYVPADRPQIAFVVALENGGSGAKAAAPLAHELITELLELGLIAPAQAK